MTTRNNLDAYRIVTERDNNICQRCLRDCGTGVTSRDHRKNRSQGGLTTPSNLQVLGGTGTTGCHGWVTEHPFAAVRDGWTVPGWGDPKKWPARRWQRTLTGTLTLGWCLYDDDGNVAWISQEIAEKLMKKEEN